MHRSAQKTAFSVTEVAAHTGVCRDAIYGAIRAGQLKAKKFGRRTIILRSDLEDYLRSLPELILR